MTHNSNRIQIGFKSDRNATLRSWTISPWLFLLVSLVILSLLTFSVFKIRSFVGATSNDNVLKPSQSLFIEEKHNTNIRDLNNKVRSAQKTRERLDLLYPRSNTQHEESGQQPSQDIHTLKTTQSWIQDHRAANKELVQHLFDPKLHDQIGFLFGEEKSKIASTKNMHLNAGPWSPRGWPTMGWIQSRFGKQNPNWQGESSLHTGLDFKAPLKSRVRSTQDGWVVFAGTLPIYGQSIWIRHAGDYTTLYAHLNEIDVERFDRVTRGQIIGKVGSSGSTLIPHLHYEIRRSGIPVDPSPSLGIMKEIASNSNRL